MNQDELEEDLSIRLGLCGCGEPMGVLEFVHKLLTLKIKRRNEEIDYPQYFELRDKLISESNEVIMWLIEYWLNDKQITEHGGNASGSWLDDKDFYNKLNQCIELTKNN